MVSVLGQTDPVSVTKVAIYGLGTATSVSLKISGWHILLYVQLRYRSSPFMVLKRFRRSWAEIEDVVFQISTLNLQLISTLGSRPGVLLYLYFFGLEDSPLFYLVYPFYTPLFRDPDGLFLTTSSPFTTFMFNSIGTCSNICTLYQ